jgi:hypothetical protein
VCSLCVCAGIVVSGGPVCARCSLGGLETWCQHSGEGGTVKGSRWVALYTVQPVHCSLFVVVYSGRQGEMVCLIVILRGASFSSVLAQCRGNLAPSGGCGSRSPECRPFRGIHALSHITLRIPRVSLGKGKIFPNKLKPHPFFFPGSMTFGCCTLHRY